MPENETQGARARAQYYRDEAKRFRELAERLTFPGLKEKVLAIAKELDWLAEQNEKGIFV